VSEPARVLIADDEESIRFFLRETLEEAGHEVLEVANGDDAAEALTGDRAFFLAFLDIRMPGPSGLEILDQVQAAGSDVPIVIITAQNTFENAVEAMKRGALDYLVKPFGMAEVLALVEKARRTHALQREVRALRREVAGQTAPGERLVGKSPTLLEIYKTIGRVAASDVPVLITGESGTGKELVARAIHNAGPRAEGPFVAINTAAIPRDLLESELFGHERGAFTGAVQTRSGRFRDAAGGTLFLDEIGDMPVELQAKLLRVLQTGEVTSVGARHAEHVKVRILAATNRDPDEAVAEGQMREDLLYRLRVVPIHMPPLRERPEDVPLLVRHFVQRYGVELSGQPCFLAESTVAKLCKHDWPGNVRELENAVKRALVLAASEVLQPDDFDFLGEAETRATGPAGLEEAVTAEAEALLAEADSDGLHAQILERVERPLLEAVLRETDGNQIRAAARLGINRNTLRKKIAELSVRLPRRP